MNVDLQGVTLLVIMRVKEIPRKKWGQTSENPIMSTNAAATNGSSYIPPQPAVRASHSSSIRESDMDLLVDSDLQGLDTLIDEYVSRIKPCEHV